MSTGVVPVGRALTSTQAPFFRILSPLPTLWWLILCVSLMATRCLVIRPLNYATSFPACPACRLEITGSLSHRSPMNQFLTINLFISVELPRWLRWLKKIIICLQYRRPRFDPWFRKISWRQEQVPTPTPGFLLLLWSQALDTGGSGLNCPMACRIFPDQGGNPSLLHQRPCSLPLNHQGSPLRFFWWGPFLKVFIEFVTKWLLF